ncbi:MAG TPA: class I SAM-dependent methyltransferase [Gaiellaceae bacterium]
MFESDTAYDSFMGRYSTRLAAPFADFAGIRHGMRVADVGAGTGALTLELVRRGATVAAAEPSAGFVASLRERLPAVDVHDAPAEKLPWQDESFDAAVAQLVIAFMADAAAGVAEMRRIVRAGGTVAVCMWDGDGMEMLAAVRRTQQALSSGGPMPEGRVMYRTRESIESLFGDGFGDVTTDLLEIESSYTGFDEFWNALRGGIGPAGSWAEGLEGDAVDAARAELRRQLGEPEGEFRLAARAWATRAERV